MSNLIYVHNKETGEISRKPVGEVNGIEEEWYVYLPDSLRPLRVIDGVNPQDSVVYLHDEDFSNRPVREPLPPPSGGGSDR